MRKIIITFCYFHLCQGHYRKNWEGLGHNPLVGLSASHIGELIVISVWNDIQNYDNKTVAIKETQKTNSFRINEVKHSKNYSVLLHYSLSKTEITSE